MCAQEVGRGEIVVITRGTDQHEGAHFGVIELSAHIRGVKQCDKGSV